MIGSSVGQPRCPELIAVGLRHVDEVWAVEIELQALDRKGRRWLRIKPASRGSGGCMFELQPEDLPQVEPFVDRVLAAIPES